VVVKRGKRRMYDSYTIMPARKIHLSTFLAGDVTVPDGVRTELARIVIPEECYFERLQVHAEPGDATSIAIQACYEDDGGYTFVSDEDAVGPDGEDQVDIPGAVITTSLPSNLPLLVTAYQTSGDPKTLSSVAVTLTLRPLEDYRAYEF